MPIPRQVFYKGNVVNLYQNDDAIQTIELHDFDMLSVFAEFSKSYSYRGQANATWPLKTTFERFLETCPNSKISADAIERKIIQRYKSNVVIYQGQLGYDPSSQDVFDTLADIQHYGGPTRLLDFTDSFNIAAFFSVINNGKDDAAVYCIRNVVLNASTVDITKMLKASKVPIAPNVNLPEELNSDLVLQLRSPTRRNERVQNQSGHFLFAGSPRTKFQDALSYSLGGLPIAYQEPEVPKNKDRLLEILLKASLIKVLLPKTIHHKMIRLLNSMGLSFSRFFPDINGLAKSLYEIDLEYL